MREKIKYLNSKGESIELANSHPFILVKITGIDGLNNILNTTKAAYQNGVTCEGKTLDKRNIVIEGALKVENLSELEMNKERLLAIFNPELEGTLFYENSSKKYKINCEIETAPIFSEFINDEMCDFIISILCPDPLFKEMEEKRLDLAKWNSNFEFPFSFETNLEIVTKAEFGYRSMEQIVNIHNGGTTKCPIIIELKAIGDVVNPYIENIRTKEVLKINKTLVSGDKVIVTTKFENKNIYINGEKKNKYYDYMNSSWLQLEVGDNLLKYDAESGVNNLECSIRFTPQFLGV